MASVIIQARDWSDWYVIRDWLNANAPGEWQHRSVKDNAPAAFEYPHRYQAGLTAHLYPAAPLPVETPAPVVPVVEEAPLLTGGELPRFGVSRHAPPPPVAVGETEEVVVGGPAPEEETPVDSPEDETPGDADAVAVDAAVAVDEAGDAVPRTDRRRRRS